MEGFRKSGVRRDSEVYLHEAGKRRLRKKLS